MSTVYYANLSHKKKEDEEYPNRNGQKQCRKKETMAHKTQNALVFLKNLRLVIFSEHMKTLNSVFNERKNQLVKIDTRW